MRILVPTTDAFGALGGIAQYNRDLLTALCSHPAVTEVVALPRNVTGPLEPLPSKLRFETAASGGLWPFVRTLAKALSRGRFDAVLCGHVNLLPFARYAASAHRCPLLLMLYGVEVWQPTARPLVNHVLRTVDGWASISQITADRCAAWAQVSHPCAILPNAITLSPFAPGPKPAALLERYHVRHRSPLLLTLARLSAQERYKGVDEMLAVLPRLARRWPSIGYVIAGDGSDKARLEQVARDAGVADRVVFAGRVSEAEKQDHYRLADVFVMPGRGEGFGFVFLEALACGVPVVASRLDGSREAVRGGLLGALADPDDPDTLEAGIASALEQPHGVVPDGLSYFEFPAFEARVHAWMNSWPKRGHKSQAG